MKVIILHGWTYSLGNWQTFLEILIKKGIYPNMLNVPGLTSKNDKVWNMEDYVNWLKEIVDKEKDKVILIGHSNGGRIAANFAIKYPEKISKLILIDSAGIYHNELPLALKRVIFKTLAKAGKVVKGSSILKNIFYKIVGETDYINANRNMKQTMINLLNSDKSLKPENIQTPTLIFWGKEDKITPVSDGRLLNRLIKNSKFFVIDNARHSPQFTHPKEVADIILNTLTV
ncbi:MAG: alpha/beta hydrolase [Candidatus Levybacteria bacterium]|nr:alpha/beta hydrolase [Candidatus Levybacteria bacterium]